MYDGTLPDIDSVCEWLDNQHCTLWSTFNIGPEGNTVKAAIWFLSQMESFNKFAANQ